jgi:hypothetical protein
MIKCKALEEQSMFVTAKGDILPCCHMYRAGPALNDDLREIIKEENFESLIKSWDTPNPYKMCKIICDDSSDNPLSMKKFDNQWKIKDTGNT